MQDVKKDLKSHHTHKEGKPDCEWLEASHAGPEVRTHVEGSVWTGFWGRQKRRNRVMWRPSVDSVCSPMTGDLGFIPQELQTGRPLKQSALHNELPKFSSLKQHTFIPASWSTERMLALSLQTVYCLSTSCSSLFKAGHGGAWVAQSVKQPTPDFASGHDLRVVRWSRLGDGACLRFSLPLPLPL